MITKHAGVVALAALFATALTAGTAEAVVKEFDAGGDGSSWEDALNWTGDSLPAAADLVFENTTGQTVTLSSNQEIDALRFADGANLTHTGGTLTVGGAGPDTESSFPEFGPNGSTYALSNDAAYNQTDGGLFILGRAGPGTLTMQDTSSITNAGEIWLGMDSTFNGTLTGSASIETLGAAAIQMARFGSPSSELSLSDTSSLTAAGFFVMSDFAGLSGSSLLTLNGSGLSVDVGGLFAREGATLAFNADGSGVSTIVVNGPSDLFDNGGGLDPQLSVDLSLLGAVGDVTLIDKTDGATVNGIFRGLPEGSVVPGSLGRTITYVGNDGYDVVLLSSVPEPASAGLSVAILAIAGMARRRK